MGDGVAVFYRPHAGLWTSPWRDRDHKNTKKRGEGIMKSPATSGPRRKSRINSAKHDPTVADVAATGSSNGSATTDIHARIAALAYELYEQRGRRDGYDLEDWLMAEQRVLTGRNSETAEAQRP